MSHILKARADSRDIRHQLTVQRRAGSGDDPAAEQEFDSLEGQTGEYMNHPIHWGLVDAIFDARVDAQNAFGPVGLASSPPASPRRGGER
jgi:hypothetical protein